MHAMTNYLVSKGFTGPDAAIGAYGTIYRQLHDQMQMQFLAFMDCFRVIGWITLANVPLAFFIRKFVPSDKPSTGHGAASLLDKGLTGQKSTCLHPGFSRLDPDTKPSGCP
jgi:hypothetical protein